MQRLKNLATSITIVAFLLLPATTSSHNQETRAPETPPGKFRKAKRPMPNRYIVVLEDDVVPDNLPPEVRRQRVAAIARSHARTHGGTVDFIYETALKGYAIELSNEAAARAISNSPQVKWVEEDAVGDWAQAPPSPQPSPPWGLDSLDSGIPAPQPDFNTGKTTGSYGFGANGTGVNAYILDSGINTAHQDFTLPSRASEAADCFTFVNCVSGTLTPFFNQQACVSPMPNATNNDCHGHGTHVAGIVGGNTYGAAKNVNLKSVKIGSTSGVILSAAIAGVNWVTGQASPSAPSLATMAVELPINSGIETAVQNSLNAGVTYVVDAGNGNTDARNISPADVTDALTVGAVDWTGTRPSFSNWGPGVDLFAPGVSVVSALTGNFLCTWNGSNTSFCLVSGTSQATGHVAGAVAMYLQGRPGQTSCGANPIQGVAPVSGNVSPCPDRVARFIKANAVLSKLTNINGTLASPNRFISTGAIPAPTNPVDNQRFYVWQQYADFLPAQPEPDEGGLNFWTSQITGNCGTGVNTNNSCTATKRIDVSRAFWVTAFPSLFNAQGTTDNSQFVHLCYQMYLRRSVPDTDAGFQFWLNDLSSHYGNPANFDGVNHLIDAFIHATDYRQRFGPA
jgi:subtilisin family serine protease